MSRPTTRPASSTSAVAAIRRPGRVRRPARETVCGLATDRSRRGKSPAPMAEPVEHAVRHHVVGGNNERLSGARQPPRSGVGPPPEYKTGPGAAVTWVQGKDPRPVQTRPAAAAPRQGQVTLRAQGQATMTVNQHSALGGPSSTRSPTLRVWCSGMIRSALGPFAGNSSRSTSRAVYHPPRPQPICNQPRPNLLWRDRQRGRVRDADLCFPDQVVAGHHTDPLGPSRTQRTTTPLRAGVRARRHCQRDLEPGPSRA